VRRSRSRSRSCFTTDGQSVSMPWYRAPLWDLRPDITSCLKVAVLFRYITRLYPFTDRSSELLYDRQSVRQSVSMPWYRAPLWDLRPDITCCCLKFAVLFLWGAHSDERTDVVDPTFYRQPTHRWRSGFQPYVPALLYPPERTSGSNF
jgi:hypothetical protein